MLDEYINSTGKVADSDTQNTEFKENAQGEMDSKMQELAEELGASKEEIKEELQESIQNLENEKLKAFRGMAERIEESLAENFSVRSG